MFAMSNEYFHYKLCSVYNQIWTSFNFWLTSLSNLVRFLFLPEYFPTIMHSVQFLFVVVRSLIVYKIPFDLFADAFTNHCTELCVDSSCRCRVNFTCCRTVSVHLGNISSHNHHRQLTSVDTHFCVKYKFIYNRCHLHLSSHLVFVSLCTIWLPYILIWMQMEMFM